MEQLKAFCEQLAFTCRIKYVIDTSYYNNTDEIKEQIDESIIYIFENIKKAYSLNKENIDLFQKFFFDCLDNTENWKISVSKFGRDFICIKDFLKDCLNKI